MSERFEPCPPPSLSSDKQGSTPTLAPPVVIMIMIVTQPPIANHSHPLSIIDHPSPMIISISVCLKPVLSFAFKSSPSPDTTCAFLQSSQSGNTGTGLLLPPWLATHRSLHSWHILSVLFYLLPQDSEILTVKLAHPGSTLTIYPQFSRWPANGNISLADPFVT